MTTFVVNAFILIDLKRFRKENKLNQSQVCVKIGLSQSVISRYETGRDCLESVTERILKAYPEAIDYKIDAPYMTHGELKSKYSERLKEIESLKYINSLLEQRLNDYKKLLKLTEEMSINKNARN